MMAVANEVLRRPWLPTDGARWHRAPTKHFYRIDLGKMLQGKPSSRNDIAVPYLKAQHIQWGQVSFDALPSMWAHPREIDALHLRSGDLLVCEGGEVGRCAIVDTTPPDRCIIQNAIHRVRPQKGNSTRYLSYLLQHAAHHGWFDVLCNRATIAHFTVDKFRDFYISLPSPLEQKATADFLDRETSRIDQLVRAKEKMLGLMAEKRRTVITRAATQGLDSSSPLRSSNISWLAKIPEHWETERTRWLFHERDDRSETGEEELLSVSHISGVTKRSEKDVNMFEAETNAGHKLCCKDDLVINTLWAWMGAMGVSPIDGIVSPAYNVYTPNERLDPAYVDALVRMPVFAEEVTRYSKGIWSSRLRLYPEGFFEVSLPVPPLDEQRAIVAHIAAETSRLDTLHTVTVKTIRLLRERRAALIAAAVTGQLNIAETT